MAGASLLLALGTATSACLDDPDCGICDKDNLVLQSISGPNYAGELVHLVSPKCEGPECPAPFTEAKYYVDRIGPCEQTDAAQASPRGPEEYCKISPLVAADGLQFVFNNLLKSTTIELVRNRPDGNGVEVYDWKTRILELQGPISRFRGDVRPQNDGLRSTRSVNLTCIDNLAEQGQPFDATRAAELCDVVVPRGGRLVPQKMRDGTVIATRGRTDDRALGLASRIDCETPATGADTCCSQCDYALSTQVAKYGLTGPAPANADLATVQAAGLLAAPDAGALTCDPRGDRLIDCREFVAWTDRSDETLRFEFAWDCPNGAQSCGFPLAKADLLRQTHPDERPEEAVRRSVRCESDAQCQDPAQAGLSGFECVGTDAQGRACSMQGGDDSCHDGWCAAPWFVECRASLENTGAAGYCVDTRHDDAAGSCFVAEGFPLCDAEGQHCAPAPANTRLSRCDRDGDGILSADECCDPGTSCDPLFTQGATPLTRYERNPNLPHAARDVSCGDRVDDPRCNTRTGECRDCDEALATRCADQLSIAQTCSPGGDTGDYAVNFVTRLGGVIYDPALHAVKWEPADLGGEPRSAIEACAESRGLIDPRTAEDGWRAHDALGLTAESYEDFDRGMCSGSTYTVVFATPEDGPHAEVLRDKAAAENTLEGKSRYTFETPQFHVVPNSGFPQDSVRIGACDQFTLAFSNKYDLSPQNLGKLALYKQVDGQDEAQPTAGGAGCMQSRAELDADANAWPCLEIDVSEQSKGVIGLRVDAVRFGPVLEEGSVYHLVVPGLVTAADMSVEERYAAAFWDVCGMPLILGGAAGGSEYEYTFMIDPPRCNEDEDGDQIQYSCDNAPKVRNTEQADGDGDGVGDVVDPCATLAEVGLVAGDSDRDGVGNACDVCQAAVSRYNATAASQALPSYMYVRNVPSQNDADGDGIGDVCDNCPSVANCGVYGPGRPWRPGDGEAGSADGCQFDGNDDMIGDACAGLSSDGAAGPMGFGDWDDFDQDGLANLQDACPRQPVNEQRACTSDDDCAGLGPCALPPGGGQVGRCNHVDTDLDGVGDICDTCPTVLNSEQVFDGGAQEDDPDGDFIGKDCELGATCNDLNEPRPHGFYEVASEGMCCTTLLVEGPGGAWLERDTGRPLRDPDGMPVTRGCDEASGSCRALPPGVAATPGVIDLPPGCEGALAAAGMGVGDNRPVTSRDVEGDLDALWERQCTLPARDQDFDGWADACDLCPYAFDPANAVYIDANGKRWPQDGAACNGSYAASLQCAAGDEGEDGAGSTGGSGSGEG